MRKRMWYPKISNIIDNNKRVLNIYKASKADHHQVRGLWNVQPAIDKTKKIKGDIYDKASVLMKGINQAHAFASANKRTAYFTGNEFIAKNSGFLIAKKRNRQKEIAIKIREGRITNKEVADWLRNPNKKKVYGRDR